MKRRAFKVTRLKLSQLVPNSDDRTKLEMMYAEYEAQRQISVDKFRRAVEAQSEAQEERMKEQRLQVQFLRKVAEYSGEVSQEPIWFIFRKEGDVVLESPFTERMQRNLVRAQISQLENQIHNTEEGKDDLTSGFYEESEDEEPPTHEA